MDISTISERRGKRWTVQIRGTVDQLHAIGLIWEACNRIIDLINSDTHDAWSIDFERGSSGDWVDKSMETKESYVLGVEEAC